MRAAQEDWEDVARFVVATFRAGTARAGDDPRAADLMAELSEQSADFRRLWRDNDVLATGEGVKRLRHPLAGPISVEFSSFAVDGRPDLRLIVYNPAGPEDVEKLRALCAP